MKLRQSELRAGHDDFREAAMTIPLVRIEQRADSWLYADLYFFIFLMHHLLWSKFLNCLATQEFLSLGGDLIWSEWVIANS